MHLSGEKIQQLDPSSFVVSCSLSGPAPKHIIITIHGIRDDAASWNAALQQISYEQSLRIGLAPTRYPRWSSLPFVLGIGWKQTCENIKKEISEIVRDNVDATFHIVCHSNGTKILAEIVTEIGVRFDVIVLLGSICKRDDVVPILSTAQHVINDCGVLDRWPTVAMAIRPRSFADTGVIGFQRNKVRDRYFEFGHSGGLTRSHLAEFILPLILEGTMRSPTGASPNTKLHNPTYYRRAGILLAALCTLIILRGCFEMS